MALSEATVNVNNAMGKTTAYSLQSTGRRWMAYEAGFWDDKDARSPKERLVLHASCVPSFYCPRYYCRK